MTKNLGTIDRALRVVVGLGLIGATVAGYLPVWGWIGVVPLATAAIGWLPGLSALWDQDLRQIKRRPGRRPVFLSDDPASKAGRRDGSTSARKSADPRRRLDTPPY